MNALLTQGHGNWDELAKCVPLKTADQCKLHFDKFYIENRLVRLLLIVIFWLLRSVESLVIQATILSSEASNLSWS